MVLGGENPYLRKLNKQFIHFQFPVVGLGPGMRAADNGGIELAQLLIAAGADVNEPAALTSCVTTLREAALGGFVGLTLKFAYDITSKTQEIF